MLHTSTSIPGRRFTASRWDANVAAIALRAVASQDVGSAMGLDTSALQESGWADQLARRTVTGLVAGTAAALAHGGRVVVQQVATDAFGNALGASLADRGQDGAQAPLPAEIAAQAEGNPAIAAAYRSTVKSLRASGIADDQAQALALRGFDLRSAPGDADALNTFKQDVLIARGATASEARSLLDYLGLLTAPAAPMSPATSQAIAPWATVPDGATGDFAQGPDLPPVTVSARGGFSATGQFLHDWQTELAGIGTAAQKMGQWMDDHPLASWSLTALQAAATPLLFAGQKLLEHSPLGDPLRALTGAAFQAATAFVDDEGAIDNRAKAALMTLGGVSALSLAAGGVSLLQRAAADAALLARQVEHRRIAMNFDRDGGIDPHLVDPRVLAQARLSQMQQQFSPMMARGDAHFLTKHGPQTMLAQQYERAVVGWPNKNGKLVRADASRFFNAEDMEDAIRRAMAQRQPGMSRVEVDMGKPIGEGFMKTRNGMLPEYRQSSMVIVNFDTASALPFTAFPALNLGAVIPAPRF